MSTRGIVRWSAGILSLAAILAISTFPAAVRASGHQARIVYSTGGQVISIKADGSGRRELTRKGKGRYAFPTYSPSGDRILAIRDGRSLVSIPIRGGKGRVIYRASKGRELKTPSFDRGGRIFLLDRFNPWRRGPGDQKVVSMRQDGSGRKVVFERRPGRNDYRESLSHVDVDPAGSRLVMSAESFRGTDSPLELYDLRSHRLTTLRASATGGDWSPDGRRILFGSQHQRIHTLCNNSEICWSDMLLYTVRPDGSGIRRISKPAGAGSASDARFSADGSHVVFSSDRNNFLVEHGEYGTYPAYLFGGNEIYSVRTNGSCETWLSNGNRSSAMPSWSPGAKQDFSAGHCGPSLREPLIEGRPGRWRRADGSPSPRARYWLGPVQDGIMFERGGSWEGSGSVDYQDCSFYFARECGYGVQVEADLLCSPNYPWRDDRNMLWDGDYEKLTPMRGAVMMESKAEEHGGEDRVLMTDRQVITFEWFKMINEPMSREDFIKFTEQLRAVGEPDASGQLPPPVFRAELVDRAHRVAESLASTGSVDATAEALNMRKIAVGSFARFAEDLDELDQYQSVPCKKR